MVDNKPLQPIARRKRALRLNGQPWLSSLGRKKSAMKKLWMASTAAVALALHSTVSAADLVALVDLEFIRKTDKTAAVMCFGDTEDSCGVWATFYLYKARIRRVISGTELRKTVLVLYGRHSLLEKDFRGVHASMIKLEENDEKEPQYQITSWGAKRELVCFPRREDDEEGLEVRDGEDSSTCYSLE